MKEGGGTVGLSLGQFLEAFQQPLRRAALLGSQRRHEEVQVVEHGHVIVRVRLRHLEQLAPALPHADT